MAGGKEYVFKKGDTLKNIAQKNGYKDLKEIWDAPENKDLKKKRTKPEGLVAGDKLILPEQKEDKEDKDKKDGKDDKDGKDEKQNAKEFLQRLMAGKLTPEDKKVLMPDLYGDLMKASPNGKEQVDLQKALKGLGQSTVKGSNGLDDLAGKVKKHIEITKGDWVIKPDLGTILGGLKDLAKKAVK
jgi:hypothetical protein